MDDDFVMERGYEVVTPESAVQGGVARMALTKLWFQVETREGATNAKMGATYEVPFGKEIVIGIPLEVGAQEPGECISLADLAALMDELTVETMKRVKGRIGE